MRRSVYLARMLLALISAAIGVPNQAVYAMEGGKTAYANGLLTEFGALVPKPGQINLDTYSLGLDMYKNVGANGQKLGGGFDASATVMHSAFFTHGKSTCMVSPVYSYYFRF